MSELTIPDKNLINFLTDGYKPNETNDTISSELFDIISINNNSSLINSMNKGHIKKMYDLFIKLHDEGTIVNEFLSLKLAKNIINLFINDNECSNYPKEMFGYTFVNFIINNNIFFKSLNLHSADTNVFRLLIHKSTTVNHFNFKLEKGHINMYINEIRKIKLFIKTQLMSYIMLNSYEVNLGINCIKLAHNYLVEWNDGSGHQADKTIKQISVCFLLIIYSKKC